MLSKHTKIGFERQRST